MILSFGILVPYPVAVAASGATSASAALSQAVASTQPSAPPNDPQYSVQQAALGTMKSSSKEMATAVAAFRALEGTADTQKAAFATALTDAKVPAGGSATEAQKILATKAKTANKTLTGTVASMKAEQQKANAALKKYTGAAKKFGAGAPDSSAAAQEIAGLQPAVVDNEATVAGNEMNLGEIMKTVGLLAAGAAAGFLGKSLLDSMNKKDEDEKEDEDEEEDEVAEVAATTTTTECGENTVEEDGICVVTSEEDKCFLDDGTEDTTKTRNADGNCVALDTLCETGYTYDSVDKVCEKSNCESGYTENDAGECIADNDTGGDTIDVGDADPIMGDAETEAEEEVVSASKVAKTGISTTSSSGGSSSGLDKSSGASSGRSAASFQSGSGGTSTSGSSYGSGGGGDGEKSDGEGKDAEVQYNALKWKNPKKEKTLRDAVRNK